MFTATLTFMKKQHTPVGLCKSACQHDTLYYANMSVTEMYIYIYVYCSDMMCKKKVKLTYLQGKTWGGSMAQFVGHVIERGGVRA